MSALDRQIGGEYYKHFKIQPYELFYKNKVAHHKAAIIRRIVRYNSVERDSLKELGKIIHECDLIMELWDTTFYKKIKETVKQKFEKIKLKDFLKQSCLNETEKYVIKKIYKHDTFSGQGKYDIKKIKSLVTYILLSKKK